ncbi:MAG TPA: diguanylate cyclase [Planctomycetota bacterium]|nr:diguanylate cyclase [Planctomycetota bacterium]
MKVLIAEDEPLSRHRLQSLLEQWNYDVLIAEDGQAAWAMLRRETDPLLVVLDWRMPGLDGVEVCRKIREQGREPYIYVLLLTGMDRKEDIIRGLDAGADDYLTKPFDSNELQVRLRAGRRIVELQSRLVAAREELRQRATHDPLTGLWNRSAVLDILKMELARSVRERISGAVCLADLDHFKHINDSFGHLAGDSVLSQTASRMRTALRAYDAVGRYGGEEFLFVLPGCSQGDALEIAQRIRASGSLAMDLPEGHTRVTVSIGMAAWSPEHTPTLPTLLRAADAALYRAKAAGRDRVEAACAEDYRKGEILRDTPCVLTQTPGRA